MTTTTYAEFNENTEAIKVAQAFAGSIRGKNVLITGVNIGGIGFTTSEAFASQSPANLILAGRSLVKIQHSIDVLKEKFPKVVYRPFKLDLSSQKSVRAAADEILSWSDVPALDIIVNSAGVMGITERTMNEDKIEMHFATNHIGHFLFTCLVVPKLAKAAEGQVKGATRVINVSSLSPLSGGIRWSDINSEKRNRDLPEEEQPPYEIYKGWGLTDAEDLSYIPMEAYSQSKVANLLFSIGMNRRLYDGHGILSLAVHPGVIVTELGRNSPPEVVEGIQGMIEKGMLSVKTLGAGAATSLVAALDPKLGAGEAREGKENYGVYLIDCQINGNALAKAESNIAADKLWALSEELVKEKFSW